MITEGPIVEKYAKLLGVEPKDVVSWMNGYVTFPDPLQPEFATEQERESAIKQYVVGQVNG